MAKVKIDSVMLLGVVLMVASGMVAFGIMNNPERPDVFFGLIIEGISGEAGEITEPVAAAVSRGQDSVDSIVWFSGIWAPPNAAAFARSHDDLMAFAAPVMAFGAEVYEYMPTFGAAAMTIPAENLSKVAGLASVDFIDEDRVVRTPTGLTTDEIATVLDFSSFWDDGMTGEGIDIAFLDSGGVDGIGLTSMASVVDADPIDIYGHGSAVGYLLTTLAPDARIHSIRVLDSYGSGKLSTVLKGLENAVQSEYGPEVINMSLGIQTGIFDSLSRACEMIHYKYDIDIFASAGNSPRVHLSPAKSPSVVSVGAVDSNLDLTYYSARSFDVVAIGGVQSLWLGSIRNLEGTSFSSPIVAALWANFLSGHPEAIGKSTDETATLLAGSEITAQGHSLPTGAALAVTEPVPEPPLWVQALPWVVLAVGLGVAGVGILMRRRKKGV